MGIPSYYKKLCDTIPGLLSKTRRNGSQRPSHLWVDFNCMVYHCIRRPGARPYEGEATRVEWEQWLIGDVCKYLKKVAGLVNPSEQVFVGVDGVVPMAKMRQQRLRRFKSHWTAAEEVRIGKVDGTKERWDTNAITPGTLFMERLGEALKGVRTEGVRWVVSAADKPGEGEHKCVALMRACDPRACHVIYGLDADLIVLSLLQSIDELYLFREAVECGAVKYNSADEEEYRYLNITKLREVLTAGKDDGFLLDYCMAMAFVGNDFLPHGLTLKLKDGGHDILLSMLRQVREKAGPLIDRESLSWRRDAVAAVFDWLAADEVRWLARNVGSKIGQRYQPARGTTPEELAHNEWNKTPLRICDELALVKSYARGEDRQIECVLHEDWLRIYNDRWLGARDTSRICEQYCVGLDWILKYYMGGSVDFEWCFPWFVPPTWTDLKAWLDGRAALPASTGTAGPVKPQEQLSLVLPLASWWLLRDRRLRELPKKAPQLWPSAFDVFTAGRKEIWECEAMIPLFMPARLRALLV